MNDSAIVVLGALLILSSGFFVAAEYALVSARRSKVEADAKAGSGSAKRLLAMLDNQARVITANQVYITVLGIALGATLEPYLTKLLDPLFPAVVPEGVISVISILLMTYPLVVVGELIPKYLALANPDGVAKAVVAPLSLAVTLVTPIAWLFQISGQGLIKLLSRITGKELESDAATISREELAVLVKTGQTEGAFESTQAELVSKALRLDQLDARDAMVHRLDVKWVDVDASLEETLAIMRRETHSRLLVCDNDLDALIGLVYVQDVIRNLNNPHFSLRELARPAVSVPESLTLDRLVRLMREQRTQLVVVTDEYGGTQGIVTLEDVVEEIFGDMEDSLESERPPIIQTSPVRLSCKSDVRYDELLAFMGRDPEAEEDGDGINTESLAALIVEELERTPVVGDAIDLPIGRLRVEQLARSRITRVGVYLKEPLAEPGA